MWLLLDREHSAFRLGHTRNPRMVCGYVSVVDESALYSLCASHMHIHTVYWQPSVAMAGTTMLADPDTVVVGRPGGRRP